MTEDQFTKLLDKQFAVFYGQMSRHFDERFDAMRDELKGDIDSIKNTVDGIVNVLEIERDERAAVVHSQDRHKDWIRQLAKHTKAKLVPEL